MAGDLLTADVRSTFADVLAGRTPPDTCGATVTGSTPGTGTTPGSTPGD